MDAWAVVHERTTARELHLRDLPSDRRAVHVASIEGTALVLGSTQPDDHVDLRVADGLGVDVVRRRSGGGAVLLAPEAQLWIDVIVPRGDALWDDDVARATQWLGATWADALATLGIEGASVHRGAMVVTPASPVVCFAGLGPGEVTVDGAKVVGISQRRTREAARFQCVVPAVWDAGLHERLLAPGLRAATAELSRVEVGVVADGPALLEAFLRSLPRSL